MYHSRLLYFYLPLPIAMSRAVHFYSVLEVRTIIRKMVKVRGSRLLPQLHGNNISVVGCKCIHRGIVEAGGDVLHVPGFLPCLSSTEPGF